MATENRYSLWLVPEGAENDALQAVIARLAQEYGGPSFPPHITLFGSLMTIEERLDMAVRQIAFQSAPFTAYLDDIATGETYFQSLFATVRPTPPLLAARAAAQRAFPDEPARPFMPHVSLLYGEPPVETKRAIIERLRGTLPASFEARVLVAYRTEAVADWACAVRAELTG